MKKIISLCLAFALMSSLSIAAFASNQTDVGTGSYSAPVTGSTVNGTVGGTVFMVDISWSGMDFTYHGEKAPTWDAEKHTYTDRVAAYWEGQGTISVVSDSNARIYAEPVYAAAAGYETANMQFSTDKLHIASAEYGSQQSGTITVTPTGSLPNDTLDKTIGTITITIAEDPDVTLEEARMLRSASDNLMRNFAATNYVGSDPDRATELTLFNSDYSNFCSQIVECEVQPSETNQNRLNNMYNSLSTQYKRLLAIYNALAEA